MQGQIDTSFQTLQRDLFSSGLAADIGMNAFGVWLAIKAHADYNTGEAWPGMRRLSMLTGLAVGTVQKSVHRLVEAKLLRVVREAKGRSRRGNTYVARERLDVRFGKVILCTIVVDYVPSSLRSNLNDLEVALATGKASEVLADCEIIPGDGFVWDSSAQCLRSKLPAGVFPAMHEELTDDQLKAPLVQRVLQIERSVRVRRSGSGS